METEHDFVWHMNNPRTQKFKYADQLTRDIDQCVQPMQWFALSELALVLSLLK